MQRRSVLLGLAGAALGTFAGARWTLAATTATSDIGTTLTFEPKSAPYPMKGGAYDDPTVIVFVPASFRLGKSKKVDALVHFHGHNTTAKKVLTGHKLREQLAESSQNAILVVPQGPVNAADGDFGKLMLKGGLKALLAEVIKLAGGKRPSEALGDASLAGAKGPGRVVVSAHSGGYRAAAGATRRGGVDLREVYLFDSLYDELIAFADFVKPSKDDDGERRPKHKLVSYGVGGAPLANGQKLARLIEARGVDVIEETATERVTREDLVRGRAVFLLGKGVHADATLEEHALRECLRASCFAGHDKGWLEKKEKPRAS